MKEGRVVRAMEKEGGLIKTIIAKGLFKKESDLSAFLGMRVETAKGEEGVIASGFGKAGAFKAFFAQGLSEPQPNDPIFLYFQKFVNDPSKKMHQLPNKPKKVLAPSAEPPPPPVVEKEEGAFLVEGGESSSSSSSSNNVVYVERVGEIDAVKPGDMAIVKGLFSMEEDIKKFIGLKVAVQGEEATEGCVVGPFGKGGKSKVQFSSSLTAVLQGRKVTLFVPEALALPETPS